MKFFFSTGIVLAVWLQIAAARQLPLAQISDPSCKGLHRDNHTGDCKIDFSLPNETVFSSPEIATEKLLFSVLYKGSYDSGHDTMSGGHPGIDIVSAKGTPLYSISDGEVTRAEWVHGYGNTVVIKHTLGDEHVYSNYAHMDKIGVTLGDDIKEGQKIGTIGNTGFTMGALGNHVDFQITTDNSPSHPYGHTACPQGYRQATQTGVCNDILDLYTMDPLVFLRHANIIASTLPKGTKKVKKELPKINITTKSKTHQQTTTRVKTLAPITEKYVSPYTIAAKVADTLQVGTFSKLQLVAMQQDVALEGVLDYPITVNYDEAYVDIFGSTITTIQNGKKDLLIKAKKSGITKISIEIDGYTLGEKTIEIN